MVTVCKEAVFLFTMVQQAALHWLLMSPLLVRRMTLCLAMDFPWLISTVMVTLREAQRRAFEREAGIQSSDGARPEESDRPRGVVVPAPVGEAAEDVLDQRRGQARQHRRHRPEPRDHPPREEVLTSVTLR